VRAVYDGREAAGSILQQLGIVLPERGVA